MDEFSSELCNGTPCRVKKPETPKPTPKPTNKPVVKKAGNSTEDFFQVCSVEGLNNVTIKAFARAMQDERSEKVKIQQGNIQLRNNMDAWKQEASKMNVDREQIISMEESNRTEFRAHFQKENANLAKVHKFDMALQRKIQAFDTTAALPHINQGNQPSLVALLRVLHMLTMICDHKVNLVSNCFRTCSPCLRWM